MNYNNQMAHAKEVEKKTMETLEFLLFPDKIKPVVQPYNYKNCIIDLSIIDKNYQGTSRRFIKE